MHLGFNFLSNFLMQTELNWSLLLINYIKTETSKSRLRYPNQPKLHDKYWEAWINIIKKRYCKVRSFHLKKKFIIGHWIKTHHSTYHVYQNLFSLTLNESCSNKRISSCERISPNYYTISEKSFVINLIISDAIPVDIYIYIYIYNSIFRINNIYFKPQIIIDISASFHETVK